MLITGYHSDKTGERRWHVAVAAFAAAEGIPLINSVGNLGGFVGPTLVGIVNDRTGSITMSLWILGGALLLMGILILSIRRAYLKNE